MIRTVLLLVGVALFISLTIQLGPGQILAAVRQIGWSFLTVTFVYGVYQLARAAALATSLVKAGVVSFTDVLWIRLSGEAVQFLTFTGPFVAEPAKAWLLKSRGLATREAFAAVLTEYLVYTFTSAGLSIVGLAYLLAHFDPSPGVATAARVIVWVMAVFLAVSAAAIVFRIYLIGSLAQGLSRLPGVRRYVRVDIETMHRMEDLLLLVLRDRPGQLLRVAALDLVAQGLLVLEVGLILRALNIFVPGSYPFLIEAATKFASVAFFFIPTQIGAAEWTDAVVFDALGLVAASGFALAFIRRLRTLLVSAVGLAAMSALGLDQRQPA